MSFDHLKTIYRDFDIRGKYPEEINDDEVYKIGKAIAHYFKLKKVAVGRDVRPSADALFTSLTKGLQEMGVNVIDLGLCTTPMTYFMCGSTDVDATVMITASHMPSDYNGLKIAIEDAKPVTADVLQKIRKIVGTHTFSMESTHGDIVSHALQPNWIAMFKKRHNLDNSGFKVVIDPANMIGILEIDTFKAFEPHIHVHTIFDTFDHSCPNHEANPAKHDTLRALGEEVVTQGAHIGIAFDGDADRVGFVDERGVPVASDIIGILIARRLLAQYPGSTIVHDIRATRALSEEIERCGGVSIREKVGHTHIRTTMRKQNAVFGVELSGHFFYKETYFSEGGAISAFFVLELMKETGKTLSELALEVTKYHQSGEINSTVSRTPTEIYEELISNFADGEFDTRDGLSIKYPDWWCNVRPSANDPVMRLNLEAKTYEIMAQNRDQILEIIRR